MVSPNVRPSIDNIFERRRLFELLRAQLEIERVSFDGHWRDINDFLLPRRGRFFITDTNRGEARNQKIIDCSATLAIQILVAGMMGGVTSPAQQWFRLTTRQRELAELPAVKAWLDIITSTMIQIFLKSNLYKTLPKLYKDAGGFATGCVFIEEDFEDVIRTYSLPLGSFWIANDERGKVNVLMRRFRMTVRQLIDKFGETDEDGNVINWERFSDIVKQQWDAGHYETWIDVVHVVAPNIYYDPRKLESRFKKFTSVYYERGTTKGSNTQQSTNVDAFLRESGYDHFPALAFRWEVTGEDSYGTNSPGMTVLGDIKQLQHGEKRGMQAVDKLVNPPMKGPSGLRNIVASILPGALTCIDEREGQKGFSPVYQVEPRIKELEGKQQQIRIRIDRAFHVDMFLLMSRSDRREITATEIGAREREKLLVLGSVLEQLNQDVLDPLIDNTFSFMLRQGLVPEPPEELQGEELKIEYISIMAQAQKLTRLSSVERFVAFVLELASAAPQVLDKLNFDQIVDVYADITGVSSDLTLSDDEVAAIRQARIEAERRAQTQQTMARGAETAKDLSKADLSGDNALGQLVEALRTRRGGPPATVAEEAVA